MDLRVTFQSSINNALSRLRTVTDQLGVTSEQAATGKRILQPSDDPVGAVSLMNFQAQQQRLASNLSNIQDATATLNSSVSTLQDVSGIFTQARSLAINATNSGNDQNALNTLAQQADGLLNRLVSLANTQNGGRYLFSGTATTTPPFAVNGAGTYIYQGSNGRASTIIAPGQTVDTNYSGSQIFQAIQRGATVYSGPTGATAGTGTDSATGQGTLLVQHTSTTYAPGSGVQPGSSSAAGDTILGPSGTHTLQIVDTSGNGSTGTISLDNGPPITFTSSDANLKVTTPGGGTVYLNTTAITPGFNGIVLITANGTLSTDNGATSVPINFSSNQVVTNSTTGAATNVNSTNIRLTGTDTLDYTGTADAFQTLQALRDDLRNTQGLPQQQQFQAISQHLTDLERVQNNILSVVGAQSADLQNLQGLQTQVQNVQLQTRQMASNVGDADLSQVLINLQGQQNLLQLTLATTAKIFDQNLLNYLK
jgi:flagellin-like hook-associated protein FlgL